MKTDVFKQNRRQDNKLTRQKFILLITLFLSLFCASLFSATTQKETTNLYQVNLLVFKHITDKGLKSENWSNTLLTPSLDNSIELTHSTNEPTITADPLTQETFQILPKNKTGLEEIADNLQRRSDYDILLRTSWIQPIGDKETAKWIHIYGGEAFDETGKPIDASVQTPQYFELNGKLLISLNRYFDIRTELYLTEPSSIIGESHNNLSIPLQTFSLVQDRRTRSNEVNYLDHPLFGVLIQIEEFHQPLNS